MTIKDIDVDRVLRIYRLAGTKLGPKFVAAHFRTVQTIGVRRAGSVFGEAGVFFAGVLMLAVTTVYSTALRVPFFVLLL